MRRGKRQIAVHNTFVRQKYIQPYLELAAQYGYTVQIIHAEGVVFPNGDRAQSVHGVPTEIMQGMQERWELLK